MQLGRLGFAFLFLQPLNPDDRSCLKNFDNIYQLETKHGIYISALHPAEDGRSIVYSSTEVSLSTENEWMSVGPRTQDLELGEKLYEPNRSRQEWRAVTCDGENRLVQRKVWRDTHGVRKEKFGRPSLIAEYVIWDYFGSDRRVSRSTQTEHYYSPLKKEEIEKENEGQFKFSAKAFCMKKASRPDRRIPPAIEEKNADSHTCYMGVIDRNDWAEEWRSKGLGPYSNNEFPIYLRQPGRNDFENMSDRLLNMYDSKLRYRFK